MSQPILNLQFRTHVSLDIYTMDTSFAPLSSRYKHGNESNLICYRRTRKVGSQIPVKLGVLIFLGLGCLRRGSTTNSSTRPLPDTA